MGVGVHLSGVFARFAVGKPTLNLYPHTLLPGPPSMRQAMGKPTTAFEKSKKSKFLKVHESSQNGLKHALPQMISDDILPRMISGDIYSWRL